MVVISSDEEENMGNLKYNSVYVELPSVVKRNVVFTGPVMPPAVQKKKIEVLTDYQGNNCES